MLAWWQSTSTEQAIPLAAIALLSLVISGSITLWVRFAAKAYEGTPILPFEPRRPVSWTIIELIALLFVFLVAAAVFHRIYLGPPTSQPPELLSAKLLVDLLAKLTVLAAALMALKLFRGATPEDWGLVAPRPGRDLFLAFTAALAFLPPVYALNALLSRIEPTQHPVLRALQEDGDPLLAIIAIFSAGIFAPIWEELFFRVLLQGWLEKLLLHRPHATVEPAEVVELAPDSATEGAEYVAAPAGPPKGWWLPIVISSAIFAAVHFDFDNPRMDILPLFVFALGLGFLYQRTHRALPSIALHMILNLSSLAILFASRAAGGLPAP